MHHQRRRRRRRFRCVVAALVAPSVRSTQHIINGDAFCCRVVKKRTSHPGPCERVRRRMAAFATKCIKQIACSIDNMSTLYRPQIANLIGNRFSRQSATITNERQRRPASVVVPARTHRLSPEHGCACLAVFVDLVMPVADTLVYG